MLFGASCALAIGAADLGAQATASAAAAQRLVTEGRVHLSADISCSLHDAAGRARDAFASNDAAALVSVARERSIYIFVHGFHPKRFGGRPAAEDVAETWSDYVATIRSNGRPFAACMMRFDTRQGFGDHQPELGNFLHALRWMTDDPQLYDPARRIYLIGYSAGGNYIKHGLRLFQRNLEASGLSPVGRAPTRMRVLTLATPHMGTSAAWHAGAVAGWWEFIVHSVRDRARTMEDLEERRWRQQLTSEWRFIAESPGATQLRLGHPELLRQNAELRENLTPNVEVLALVGSNDMLAPVAGGQLRAHGIVEHVVPGMWHRTWLWPTRDSIVALHVEHFLGLRPTGSRQAVFASMHQEVHGTPPPSMGLAAARPRARDAASARFALLARPRSPLSLAAERYLRSRAIGTPDERELAALSDAIAARVTAVRVAPEYMRYFVAANERGEEELRLWQISGLASGDASRVPGPVLAAARHLRLEIDRLFETSLPLNAPWAPPHMARMPTGHATIVRPDSARVTYRGAGGLEEERLVPIREAVGNVWDYLQYRDRAGYERTYPATFTASISPLNDAGVKVIAATYQRDDGLKSLTYYYWHRELPPALTEELLRTLEPRHPLFRIGDPRDYAPDRQPSELPTSSLLRYAGAPAPPPPREPQHDDAPLKAAVSRVLGEGRTCSATDREYGLVSGLINAYSSGQIVWTMRFRALARTAGAPIEMESQSVNARNLGWDAARIESAGGCMRVRVPTAGEARVRVMRPGSRERVASEERPYFEFYVPDSGMAEQLLDALAAFAVPVADHR